MVENRDIDVQFTEGAAQSAIQYFENTRNFLVAVGEMKLLTFEASDLEKVLDSSQIILNSSLLYFKGCFIHSDW